MYVYIYIYIYVYINMYIYIYTDMYIYIYRYVDRSKNISMNMQDRHFFWRGEGVALNMCMGIGGISPTKRAGVFIPNL